MRNVAVISSNSEDVGGINDRLVAEEFVILFGIADAVEAEHIIRPAVFNDHVGGTHAAKNAAARTSARTTARTAAMRFIFSIFIFIAP